MNTSFVNWEYYSSKALEGRILLIWKGYWVKVDILVDHVQFIHCTVLIWAIGLSFCFTVVYSLNQLDLRKDLWSELASVSLPVKPWLVLGDFNSVFDVEDRIGGKAISPKEVEDARNWLDLGIVEEMKLLGSYYTWSNNQDGNNRIFSKIDRVFVNEDWIDMFPNVNAIASWEPTVLDSWKKELPSEGYGLHQILRKLHRLQFLLKRFNWRVVGNIVKEYEESKVSFQQAKNNLFSDLKNQILSNIERVSHLDFKKKEAAYASFLYQQSKVDWMRFGDENSSLFYSSMKKRKRLNRIVSFVDEQGSVEVDYPKVVNHFTQHFQSFLGETSATSGLVDTSIVLSGPILSIEDQAFLIKPFTFKDVQTAMFSIKTIKSPGPDGFGAGFYKSLWSNIGKEVASAVLDFFDLGHIPKRLNKTILALIPKVTQPSNA
ncbi:uncharacterized protein LOC133796135 [Humulus lupulus]|uniref:uncharacterized protein LOC133796135 n=1 Tax=Humulus lupulus TaxID=3486 RepID=UPI002B40FBA4|nr:uncharacterized protein LOC133796135 [Humulus lupulus]